jgi:hypothetical protein
VVVLYQTLHTPQGPEDVKGGGGLLKVAEIIAQQKQKTGACGSAEAKLPYAGVVEHATLGEAMVEMKTDREVSTQLVQETAGEVSIQLGARVYILHGDLIFFPTSKFRT